MPFPLPDQLARLGDALQMVTATADTAQSLYTQLGRFKADWAAHRTVNGSNLSIPVPRNQGLHPTGCVINTASLDFQFEWREGEDVPWRAEYQVCAEGFLEAEDALFELQDHWRLDTDMYAPNRRNPDAVEPKASKEPHPLFHFQRGGYAQDAFAAVDFLPSSPCAITGVWKGLMQSPGPRVPILPLDPILAIDFCISQHDGIVWERLRNLPEYLSVIEDAQVRLWAPFFEALGERAFRRAWFGPSLLV